MTVYTGILLSLILIFLHGNQLMLTAGRRALSPTNYIEDPAKVIQAFSANNAPPCLIDVQRDLPRDNDRQPLFLIPKTDQIWMPNRRGYLEVPYGASIELHCTSSFASDGVPKGTKTLNPTCVQGQTFQWQNQKYSFNEFHCTQMVPFVVEDLNKECGGTGKFFRVGNNLTDGRFIESKRICYDSQKLINHYTKYRLQPGNAHFQRKVDRLDFSKAGHFGTLNMNGFYTQRNQKLQARKLLGSDALVSQLFPGGDIYLARGHLEAKSDAVYANQQRSTFIFHNVAPQWQSFNGGPWAQLESEVRKFVNKADLDVDCYTGTWGTLQLTTSRGERKTFYLAKQDMLPVPKIYFRVIVDRKRPTRGIVLVGVNNPHVTLQDINASYTLCKDISKEVRWLSWIQNNDLSSGYIYACAVPEFQKAVSPTLPSSLQSVVEILN